MEKENKEIPFGAKDSELYKFEYTIPDGYEAEIKGGKVILKKKESKDERIRKSLVKYFRKFKPKDMWDEMFSFGDVLFYLEKKKEQQPFSQEVFDAAKHEALWGEQKPAEWSEKDEKMLETIDKTLFKASVNTGLGTIRCPYDDARDWLKSLRLQSHWKPSVEQISALDCVAGAFSPNNKEYRMVMHHINTLRNMLKQL